VQGAENLLGSGCIAPITLEGSMKNCLNLFKKLDWIVVSVLIFLPILLVWAAFWYSNKYSITWREITLTVATFYVLTVTVGVAIHRLWSHAAFKMNKKLEFVFMLLSAATFQGAVIAWASDHEKHHSYTDTDKDPHSPLKFKNKFLGFIWSHIGWMMIDSKKEISKNTMARLGKNKMLVWQFKNYWQVAVFMNTIVPSAVGYLTIGGIQGALAGLIFMGIGRALQQQVTFLINSITHFVGTKEYYNGSAGDIWWLFVILLGENWHNFHHAFANDYRNGCKWYHFDAHKWIIFLLSKMGLAWDLVRTPEERIQAKVRYESSNILKELQLKVDDLLKEMSATAQAIESILQIPGMIKDNIKKRILSFKTEALYIQQKISDIKNSEISSLKILNEWKNDLSKLEQEFFAVLNDKKLKMLT
jgi:stearoyl-CoA desaturase (delta-9 desaturase)